MFWFMSRWTAWGRKISPSAAIAVSLALLAVVLSLFFIKGFQKGPRQQAAAPSPADDLEREAALSRALEENARVTLSERILEKRPDVQKVEFHKVWTEKTEDPNARRIFFSYTITAKNPNDQDTAGAFSVESQALLKRKSPQSGDWLLSNYQAKTSALDFSEPLLLKAAPPAPAVSPAGSKPAGKKAAPAAKKSGEAAVSIAPKAKQADSEPAAASPPSPPSEAAPQR